MKKVLIKNGTIVTATDEFKGDLLLADGKIAAIGALSTLLLPTKYMMPKESM